MRMYLLKRCWAPLLALCCAATLMGASLNAPLADAVQHSDKVRVRALLGQRAAVNAIQVDGMTALHWAAYRDDLESAELLVRNGADVKAVNRYGVTPLSLAAKNGNEAMVGLFLKGGADPNTTLPGGETALMTASRTGKVEAVKALLDRGARLDARENKSGQTALMWAAAEGNLAVVETLLRAGADIKIRIDSGFTAFLFAVRDGSIPVVKALLKAGADVNDSIHVIPPATPRPSYTRGVIPRQETSALILAVANAHYQLASELLDAGADPNSNGPGYTALHAISNTRKPGTGDNPPPPDGTGNMTSLDFVRRIVAKGADINALMLRRVSLGMTGLNTKGSTPFFLAAKTADAELMRLLAQLGADTTLTNEDNSTPLMAAAGLGTRAPGEDAGTEPEVIEAMQLALDLGADINAVNRNGETAMHGAAYKNFPGAVRFLVSKGARIEIWNQKNKFGWTPLAIAAGYRFGNFKPHAETVAALQSAMTAAGVSVDVSQIEAKNIL